jgi:outer membrane protein TolC
MMQVRLEAGGALKSDVLSLDVRLAQAKEDVVRSQNALKMTMANLANLLGVSPDREIFLKESKSQPIEIPIDYAAGVAQALNQRPELKKVREQLKQSRMALDKTGAEYLPSIDLHGKYYHDDPDMSYHRDRENWTVAMVANWYFFTGLSTRADMKNASARIEEILAADRRTVLAVQLDVKNAYLRLSEAKARLEVAEKSVASAEESLELVKKQFEGGSATITRYLEAELARNTARIRATRAFYDREQAFADIGRAIGSLGIIFTQDQDG